ncbi:hypothetical protein QQF64_020508 [Cirrhinus molitorella]|uniref:Uncharacterized protein n=1 Tax=Cirrhinus molitorella TaxID=172907 RepID=A0ABR3L9I0_9TELE
MNLKEEAPNSGELRSVIFGACKNSMYGTSENSLGCDVFQMTENDNKLALSIEDTAFLRIMDSEVYRDEGNSWVAPLPFRVPRQVLPNNREQVLNRFHSLQHTLKKKPEMEKQFVAFMKKILENDHAELIKLHIPAYLYLRAIDSDGNCNVGFVLGRAKLAPQHKPTIPQLELCAAVLVVEIADLIRQEIDLRLEAVRFYCDSKVVLGPEQWFYVPTELNPADHASRGVSASQLNDSAWLKGPPFLSKPYTFLQKEQESYELVSPFLTITLKSRKAFPSDNMMKVPTGSCLHLTWIKGLPGTLIEAFLSHRGFCIHFVL